MNKRQKLVQQQFLNNEEAVIDGLKQVYGQSYKDITKKVADLDESIAYLQEVYDGIEPDGLTGAALDYFASRGQNPSPEQAQETVKSMLQSKVYQKNYQEALGKQVDNILDKMHTNEFKTVSGYLNTCYEDGFIGTMFDLQGQGIPLCFPLDQEAMVRAVQLDSKISNGLYSRMGEDVSMLKKHITSEISRGIANGMSYEQIAQQIGFKMMGTYDTPGGAYANALRIARTEGHRIQVQGGMDACYKAKEKGADVVKQWDSTLDSATRESHVAVDGEIRELDEEFSNGLMFPGDPSGGASEVVNCRCALLQRARWNLTEKMNPETGELYWEDGSFSKMNNFIGEIENFGNLQNYNEFKKVFFSDENTKYMNYVQRMEDKYKTKDFIKVLDSMSDREYNHYSKLLNDNPMVAKQKKVNNTNLPVEIYEKSDIMFVKDYTEFEDYLVNEYGINISQDIKQLDFTAVKESTAGVDYILKEFPQAQDVFVELCCDNSGIMAVGYDGSVSFNPKYYDDYKTVAFKSGNFFNDITNAVFSNGSHEAGHLLELALNKRNGGTISDWHKCTYAKNVVSEALKNAKKHPDGKGKKVEQLISEVSTYAKDDRSECLAECVSDYSINGEKAALLSKEVWKILKLELG